MPVDFEKMKALVAFKQKLEKRIEELNAELDEASATLDTVNSILLEKGFKRGAIKEVAEAPKEMPPSAEERVAAPVLQEPETVIPLKTLNEEPLAII